jgi:CBS domain-containing protein
MRDKKVRRLVVFDDNKRLVGVVSLGDLAVASHGDEEVAGKTLEQVSR